MSIFHEYPYTDFHEMNLDYLLKEVRRLRKDVDEFTLINQITLCGLWDISKSYTIWSIVIDPETNDGYLAITNTPAGVQLSNTDYWMQISNYDERMDDIIAELDTLTNTTIPAIQNDVQDNADAIDTINNTTIPGVQSGLQNEIDTINNTTIPGVQSDVQDNADAIDTINNTTIPAIQSDVQDNANAIDTINNTTIPGILNLITQGQDRHYIFIGDSYGAGYIPGGSPVQPWIEKVADYMGLDADHYFSSALNGSGFYAGTTFRTLLSNVQITCDPEDITDIVVAGGLNDITAPTFSDVVSAINNFMTYAKSNYPNAKVWIFPVGWSRDASERQKVLDRVHPAYLNSGFTGALPCTSAMWALHDYSLVAADGAHPNNAGQGAIAWYIACQLLGVSNIENPYFHEYPYECLTSTQDSAFTAGGSITFNQMFTRDGIYCWINDVRFTFTSGYMTAGTSYNLFNFYHGYTAESLYSSSCCTREVMIVQSESPTQYRPAIVDIYFRDTGVAGWTALMVKVVAVDGAGFLSNMKVLNFVGLHTFNVPLTIV